MMMIEHLTREICPALGGAEWLRSTQRNLVKSPDRPQRQSPENMKLLILELFDSRIVPGRIPCQQRFC